MTALLDVNVLMALAWPNHMHHEAASRWFEKRDDGDWATCLLTQSGFVRLSLNRVVVQAEVTAEEVLEMLAELVASPDHQHLADCPPLEKGRFSKLVGKLTGYRQVTDAMLLHVADHHRASLTTFDQAIQGLAPDGIVVETIPT